MRKIYKVLLPVLLEGSLVMANPTYDNLNRLTSETYPDGSFVNYVYDNAGNLTTVEVIPSLDRDEDDDKMLDRFEQTYSDNNTKLDPFEDLDGDGKSNLWEFAFGFNPTVVDAFSAAGQGTAVEDPEDGKTYVQWTYQRRKNSPLTYIPAVSSDLATWSALPIDVQTLSAASLGDEIESVTVRCLRALEENNKCFFRVKAE